MFGQPDDDMRTSLIVVGMLIACVVLGSIAVYIGYVGVTGEGVRTDQDNIETGGTLQETHVPDAVKEAIENTPTPKEDTSDQEESEGTEDDENADKAATVEEGTHDYDMTVTGHVTFITQTGYAESEIEEFYAVMPLWKPFTVVYGTIYYEKSSAQSSMALIPQSFMYSMRMAGRSMSTTSIPPSTSVIPVPTKTAMPPSEIKEVHVSLIVDGVELESAVATKKEKYKFSFTLRRLAAGTHKVSVVALIHAVEYERNLPTGVTTVDVELTGEEGQYNLTTKQIPHTVEGKS